MVGRGEGAGREEEAGSPSGLAQVYSSWVQEQRLFPAFVLTRCSAESSQSCAQHKHQSGALTGFPVHPRAPQPVCG